MRACGSSGRAPRVRASELVALLRVGGGGGAQCGGDAAGACCCWRSSNCAKLIAAAAGRCSALLAARSPQAGRGGHLHGAQWPAAGAALSTFVRSLHAVCSHRTCRLITSPSLTSLTPPSLSRVRVKSCSLIVAHAGTPYPSPPLLNRTGPLFIHLSLRPRKTALFQSSYSSP